MRERQTDRETGRQKEQERSVMSGGTFQRAQVLHRENIQLVVTVEIHCTCRRWVMVFGVCRYLVPEGQAGGAPNF